MPEEYEFRVPTETDLPDIMEIARTTWDGHDHLPEMFKDWLRNPECNPHAIEKDGKIISLGNVRLIENGTTGWMEGLRVHHEFRNKGYARIMTNHLVEQAQELGAERIRLTLSADNPVPIALAKSVGMESLFMLSVTWCAPPEETTNDIETLKVTEVSGVELIKRDLQSTSLLPSNVLVYFWYALDCSPETLRTLDSKVRFWIAEDDEEIVGLSIGLKQSTPGGLEWCSTIYAKHDASFLSLIPSQIEEARDSECLSLMFINAPEYSDILISETSLIEKWHEIGLLLFEGKFS